VIVLPYGETGLLVETDAPLRLAAQATRIPGVREVVPAARTVLLRFDAHATDEAAVRAAIDAASREDAGTGGHYRAHLVEIQVRYDGADLAGVAQRLGISEDDVIARHSHPEYVVAFCGFSPGFAYLTGLDPLLHLPRLAEPRVSVPPGSVAIAGEFTGVYPRASPGGWRLLGTTDADLWNSDRAEPALLSPGTRVRFVPT
jgi:KipI family sensor histidine kinase inhibitor